MKSVHFMSLLVLDNKMCRCSIRSQTCLVSDSGAKASLPPKRIRHLSISFLSRGVCPTKPTMLFSTSNGTRLFQLPAVF